MPKFPFIPREEKFFVLFEKGAQNAVNVASEFRNMVEGCEDIIRSTAELTEMEHQGDTITHDIIAMLHGTFVTPYDREDIAALAQRMDDVVDLIHAAAEAMLIYEIESTTQTTKELADILVEQTRELGKAMPILEKHGQLKSVLPHCVEINRLENVADKVYRAALGKLFKDTDDVIKIIKWREIYDLLETATDRCEDVANVLEGIALKHG
jgi:predicted phosphate transport protein (TIGR00153 family)